MSNYVKHEFNTGDILTAETMTEIDTQVETLTNEKLEDVKVNGESVVADKVANIDLSNYAKLGKITVTMIGSGGNIPTGNSVLIYEIFPDGTEKLVSSTLYGTEPITISVDDEVEYKVTGSVDVDDFYAPSSVVVDLVGSAEATVTYVEIATPHTIDELVNLIDAVGQDTAFSTLDVGDEVTVSWTSTGEYTYTATAMVMDKGQQYTNHETGEKVNGLRLEFEYGFPEMPQFDATERELATEETALADIYYYGTDDNSTFTLLSYNVGDAIDYSAYTYIYHNSFKDTTTNILKYGNNLLEYSAEHQWLNSDKIKGEWWESTHVGDTAPSQANTINGFVYGFNGANWLNHVLDEDFQVANNTVVQTSSGKLPTLSTLHGKFRLPMIVEMYGSPQVFGEGDNKYWEGWKLLCNNSATNPLTAPGNGDCAARRIRNLENTSFSYAWLASCYVYGSGVVWLSYGGSGYLYYGTYAYVAFRCAPAFVIV